MSEKQYAELINEWAAKILHVRIRLPNREYRNESSKSEVAYGGDTITNQN